MQHCLVLQHAYEPSRYNAVAAIRRESAWGPRVWAPLKNVPRKKYPLGNLGRIACKMASNQALTAFRKDRQHQDRPCRYPLGLTSWDSPAGHYKRLERYSLRLFVTTDMLLKAMARAARMGWSWRSIMGRPSKG